MPSFNRIRLSKLARKLHYHIFTLKCPLVAPVFVIIIEPQSIFHLLMNLSLTFVKLKSWFPKFYQRSHSQQFLIIFLIIRHYQVLTSKYELQTVPPPVYPTIQSYSQMILFTEFSFYLRRAVNHASYSTLQHGLLTSVPFSCSWLSNLHIVCRQLPALFSRNLSVLLELTTIMILF